MFLLEILQTMFILRLEAPPPWALTLSVLKSKNIVPIYKTYSALKI